MNTDTVIHMTRHQFNHFFTRECSAIRRCARCGDTKHSTERCFVYKTKLCLHFRRGCCRFGDKCTFAHSFKELRSIKPTE